MEPLDFSIFLNEKIKAKAINLKKLADMSGVPLAHLQNLSDGKYHLLPAAPYLRGYLNTLAPILGFDAQAAWDHFRDTHILQSSGRRDSLPANRFAIPANPRYVFAGLVVILLVGYLGLRFSSIFGQPVVRVDAPAENMVRTSDPYFTVHGTLDNGDTLFVNGESLRVDNGAWEKRITLQPGLNSVEISAKKFLGGESRELRQIMYEPPVATQPAASSSASSSAKVKPD